MVSDDNIFREYEDPKNKKFLEDLHNGIVPRELMVKYKSDIDVILADRK